MPDQATVHIRKSRLKMLLGVLATAALVAPTAVWAADRFDDVPDSNVFHDDIAWMAENGVTAGCNPPANNEFCPGDNVTREQMAAFMRRLDSEDVFATFDEMDGLLPLATVKAGGSGVIASAAYRAPVTDTVITRTGVGQYTLQLVGFGSSSETRVVCTAESVYDKGGFETRRLVYVDRVGFDGEFNIEVTGTTSRGIEGMFSCAFYD